MAVVFIPAPLRRLTGGHDRLVVAGSSVGALVDAIDSVHPGFRDRVVAAGDLLPSIAVSVDGDIVTHGLDEPVGPDGEVHFVPALGGGQVTQSDGYARIFEKRGGSYNAAHALAPAARERERALLLERLDLAPGVRVLDVPAGGGYVADGLRAIEPRAHVLCVEPAAQFAAGIRSDFWRARARVDQLPLAAGSIDRVASLAGMHHLDDRAAFLAECRRVLRRGGSLALADAAQSTAVAAFLDGPVDHFSETGHAGRYFARGEAAALLAAAGFSSVREEHLSYCWSFPDLDTLVRFCRTIFGLVRADLASVESALRAHFDLQVDASGARLPWSLTYASGVAD